MRILRAQFINYKSLRDLTLKPGDLSLVIGANGAGKSNLADAFDFVANIFRDGIDVAVARKGGFENIAHRKKRRTKTPLGFELEIEIDGDDIARQSSYRVAPPQRQKFSAKIIYKILLKAASEAIRADYAVFEEAIEFQEDGAKKPRFSIRRGATGKIEFLNGPDVVLQSGYPRVRLPRGASHFERYLFGSTFPMATLVTPSVPRDELAVNYLSRYIPMLQVLRSALASIRVYQLNPPSTRKYAAPNPRPELERDGQALPSVVLQLQRRRPKVWQSILVAMREVLPGLDRIEVRNTPSKTLELLFYEYGLERRPWTVDEISDGTIQTLAALVAISDPSASLIVLEEPENSVHPWIIRSLLSVAKKVAEEHQVLLTTHSPVVMDEFSPGDITVLWRESGETRSEHLSSLNPRIAKQWKKGTISTFAAVDSGLILQTIPPAPQLELEL